MKDRFVAKRFINIFLILLTTIGYSMAVCLYQGMWVDEMLLILLISLIFYVLFLFALEHNRAQQKISSNRGTTFGKAAAGYFASALIMLAGLFLPDFLKPALMAALLLTTLLSVEMAMCAGIFFSTILCLALGLPTQELLLYCLMTLFGCMIAGAMENKKFIFWHEMVILCLSVMMPGIFYYLTYQEGTMNLFVYGAIEGIVIEYLMQLFYKRLVIFRSRERLDRLSDIIEESYPTVRELSKFSWVEYEHAMRVSSISEKCAKFIGADEKVCAAAGFYYRIGIIEGEPLEKSGVLIAQRECFPEEVIKIIYEYNGKNALPSTVESAIVHMVDGLIKKLEALHGQKTMASEWNQDMVIYQTLNDFSASGLYDKSGLSMNMFLKIREYLVKEEVLL